MYKNGKVQNVAHTRMFRTGDAVILGMKDFTFAEGRVEIVDLEEETFHIHSSHGESAVLRYDQILRWMRVARAEDPDYDRRPVRDFKSKWSLYVEIQTSEPRFKSAFTQQ